MQEVEEEESTKCQSCGETIDIEPGIKGLCSFCYLEKLDWDRRMGDEWEVLY